MAETVESIKRERPRLEIATLSVNTAKEESCVKCVRDAVSAFGRIDYVLNNVGIGGSHTSSLLQDKSEMREVLDINFVGLWISQKEQIRHMLNQDILSHP
jgi:NAD(P)-dependent dehydrogenase (short-subunit alcohol dehydrogenase family)